VTVQLLLTPIAHADPAPLQTGTNTTLTVVCASLTGPIDVDSITFTIPIGTNPRDLSASSDFQFTMPDGWSVSQSGGMVMFSPNNDPATLTTITFVISNIAVNRFPGPCDIVVTESAAPTGGTSQVRTNKLRLAKYPSEFFLSELDAIPQSVNAGGTVTLTWSGSSATYNMNYEPARDGTIVNQDVSSLNSYTSVPLTRYPVVVFTLTATYTPPGSDQPKVVTRQVIVNVNFPDPKFDEVNAGIANETLDVEWKTEHVNLVTLRDDDDVLPPNGSLASLVPDRLRYTMRAVNTTTKIVATADIELGIAVILTATYGAGQMISTPGVAAAPDGSSLYVGCYDTLGQLMYRCDPVALNATATANAGASQATQVIAVSPDLTVYWFMANGSSGMLRATDSGFASGQFRYLGFDSNENPTALAFSSDGAWLYVGSTTTMYLCLPWPAARTRRPCNGPQFIAPGGGNIYFVHDSQTFAAWDSMSLNTIHELALPSLPAGVAYSAAMGKVYVALTSPPGIGVVDPANLDAGISTTHSLTNTPIALASTPHGRELVVLYSGSVDILDPATFTAKTTLTLPTGINPIGLGVAANAWRVYVVAQDPQYVTYVVAIGPTSATVTIHGVAAAARSSVEHASDEPRRTENREPTQYLAPHSGQNFGAPSASWPQREHFVFG
jgi:hypothetical protein